MRGHGLPPVSGANSARIAPLVQQPTWARINQRDRVPSSRLLTTGAEVEEKEQFKLVWNGSVSYGYARLGREATRVGGALGEAARTPAV